MKELFKDMLLGFMIVLEKFPIITGVIFFVLTIYLVKYKLPIAYRGEKGNLYVYYQRLGLLIVLLSTSIVILILQLFRVVREVL
ncbi:hypothetical protein TAESTU_31024 [Tenacibaculum aestuarii]